MELAMSGDIVEELRDMIRSEFSHRFDDLRRFVDRRIAELSMEVSGAVQIMDYSEANIIGQLARVQTTEAAASRIMEAAEAISDWLRGGSRDPAALRSIDQRINSIFEACSFQDLTGQRIRRAIANLQQVDTMLGGMIGNAAASAAPVPIEPHMPPADGPDLAQQEIDRLMCDF